MQFNRFEKMRSLSVLLSRVLLLSLAAAANEHNPGGEMALAAIEEAAALPNGFSPRFFDGAVPPHQPFARRQDTGVCPDGGHRCEDIGAPDSCCASNRYCYYKTDWQVGCCGFGTNCDAQCTSTLYRTNASSTFEVTTTLPPPTTTASGATTTGDESVIIGTTTSPYVGCATRPCALSAFQCPSSMGHGCCNNDQVCGSNSVCLAPSTTVATDVPTRGCSGTPSATDCVDGGGCCLRGETCVNVDGTPGCSGTPIVDGPAGANTTTVDRGLSQAARAGVGAGVAIAAALVIGAVTWFCIRRRRRALTDGTRTRTGGGRTPAPGGGNDAATNAEGTMSETSVVPARSRLHRHGMVYEYLGPTAVAGPYTDHDTPVRAPETHDRGVPGVPDGPGDISRPVEIGASDVKDKDETQPGFGRSASHRLENRQDGDNEVYELEAFPSPSPLSPEDFASAPSSMPRSPADLVSPGTYRPGEGTFRTDYLG